MRGILRTFTERGKMLVKQARRRFVSASDRRGPRGPAVLERTLDDKMATSVWTGLSRAMETTNRQKRPCQDDGTPNGWIHAPPVGAPPSYGRAGGYLPAQSPHRFAINVDSKLNDMPQETFLLDNTKHCHCATTLLQFKCTIVAATLPQHMTPRIVDHHNTPSN